MTKNMLALPWRAAVALVCVAGALSFAGAASAESDLGWKIRFYAAAIDMNDDPVERGSGSSLDLDVGGGLGFNAEYRFTPRLGIDVGVLGGAGVDVETEFSTRPVGWITHDTVTFTPITAGLDIHLTPDARIDVYACPLVALVQYGGLSVHSGPTGVRTEWDFDEDFTVGGALGVGVPLGGRRWSFEASLTYLESTLDGSSSAGGSRIDRSFDSTIFGFGFGYRFAGGSAG